MDGWIKYKAKPAALVIPQKDQSVHQINEC